MAETNIKNLGFVQPNQLRNKPIKSDVIVGYNFGVVSGMAGPDSRYYTEYEAWKPIILELNKIQGNKFENPAFYQLGLSVSNEGYNNEKNKIYSYIKNNKENLPENLQNLTEETFFDRTKQVYRDIEESYIEAQFYAPGLLNGFQRLLGQAGAFIKHPLSIGFAGAPTFAGASLAKQVAGNALVGGLISIIDEPEIKDWMTELGEEYGIKEMTTNLAVNMAIGGFIPILGRSVSLSLNKTKRLYNILDKKNVLTPAQKSEIEEIIEDLEKIDDNPLKNSPDQSEVFPKAEHESRLIETENALNENKTPDISEFPSSPIKNNVIKDSSEISETISLNPNQINVEAKKFQFKESDELGVTDRLQGVKKWDNYQAGLVSVYKYSDGTFSIADGHQRLALAKRLMKEDPGQDIKLNAYVFDEADGWTIPQVRAIAAVKNIAEGSGEVLDAVKVLRVDPSRLDNLPPRSQLVIQAREIIKLSDDAYGSFVNGVIPANYAAVIGRLIEDKSLHADAVTILAKADPPNVFQAESIVRQVNNAGREEIEQISLFGDEIVSKSLYAERAKILDRTFKELKTDKKSFENLIKNADTLEQEGNVLVQDLNQRRANTDGQAIAILQAVANRKGPLSDKLNEAAKLASETGNYSTAVRGFVQDVRGSIKSGDFERISDGELGRIVDDPTPRSRSEIETESNVKDFDDPNGQGSVEQTTVLENNLFGEEVIPPPLADEFADLKILIKENAPKNLLQANPFVVKALRDVELTPSTTLKFESFTSENYINTRNFNIDGKTIVGVEEAIPLWQKNAKELAFVQTKTPIEEIGYNKNVTIILGPPASGKSTIANRLAINKKAAILDADEIKKTIPEYKNGVGVQAVHEESSELTTILQKTLIEEGADHVFPKIGNSVESIQRQINLYKENGYNVELILATVDSDEVYKRMINRFVETNRIIPPPFLESVGNNPKITYDKLKKKGEINGYAEIDNNGKNPIATETSKTDPTGNIYTDSGKGRQERIEEQPILDKLVKEEEINLDLEIPINENQTITLRQLSDEIKQEEEMIKRMEFCVR
jgi:dephospho-CoA kinase